MRERERERRECFNLVFDLPSLLQHVLTCSLLPHPVGPLPPIWFFLKKKNHIQSLWQSSSSRFYFSLVLLFLVKDLNFEPEVVESGRVKTLSLVIHHPCPFLASHLRVAPAYYRTSNSTSWPFNIPFAHLKANVSSHWISFQNLLSLLIHVRFPTQSLKWNGL